MHVEPNACNNRPGLERHSSTSAIFLSPRLGWAISVAIAAASCRIYREAPSREEPALPGSAGQPATGGDDLLAPDRQATKPSASTADALNLWVLSRPKGDLPTAAEPEPASIASATVPDIPIAVVVVLGVGSAPLCAEHIAQQAVAALAAARAPLDVLASALDSARRWRWPDATSTLSATLKSSSSEFGGVQFAPPSAFDSALLLRALERRAVLGGPRSRWAAASSEPSSELAPCEPGVDPSVAGPVGVLLRNRAGHFFGGVVNVDPLADAGVVSIAAQYGVSLAVGKAGAVLMIGDCEPPPLDRGAERVYASPNWVLATAQLQTPGACRVGHALLSGERAWVAPASALASAVVEAAPAPPLVPGQAPVPAPPALAPDAGLAHPSEKP